MKYSAFAVLASVAAFAPATSNAADLPVAPAPVDYVGLCNAYGAGFFYIPGTETCLRVGGGMRVEFRFRDFAENDSPNWGTRDGDATTTRARAYARFDSRTNTEYGLLRTYVDLWFTGDSGGSTTPGVRLENGFIQFGGFTFGRAGSFFNFYTGDNWGSIIQQGFSDHRTNLFAYTYGYDIGASLTLSVEDATFVRGDSFRYFNGTSAYGLYGGHKWPDLVANLRVDQGWGSAQIMGALHQVYGRGSTFAAPVAASETGFAIGAGVTFNAPMIAQGDTISFQAAYAKGAVRYVHEAAAITDAISIGTSRLQSTTGWGIGGGFTHHWTPTVYSAATANFASFQNDLGGVAPLELKVEQWGVQGNLVWAPVTGFLMGVELEYEQIRWNNVFPPAASDDNVVGVLRVQRTF